MKMRIPLHKLISKAFFYGRNSRKNIETTDYSSLLLPLGH